MSDVYQGLSGFPNFRCLGAADSGAIIEAEAKLGLSFSKEYRSYLESCSFASVNGHELTGICKSPRLDVVGATRAERGNWPTSTLLGMSWSERALMASSHGRTRMALSIFPFPGPETWWFAIHFLNTLSAKD